MGCYINPESMTKEAWLARNGRHTPQPCAVTEEYVPVCLVDNGDFTAAAVAYSEDEKRRFAEPDGRPRFWFQVPRALARLVSDLARYEALQ